MSMLATAETRAGTELYDVQVRCTRVIAQGITAFELSALDGELPAWEPGSHIDVHLPSGTVRQYSLCGEPEHAGYQVAVLEQPAGRGGSVEVHRELRAGQQVRISAPRNNFALAEQPGYTFVAGGIGITPILSMIRSVQAQGGEWTLFYAVRSEQHAAFLEELHALDPARVMLLREDVEGRLDLDAVLTASAGTAVYCCGPGGLMDALGETMRLAGRAEQLFLERFAAAPATPAQPGTQGGFTVELARSGGSVAVAEDESVLEALRRSGLEHASSCEMGICGTCEATVLEGEVDHRDDLLTEAEKASNSCMMTCVSRACGAKLVLDL